MSQLFSREAFEIQIRKLSPRPPSRAEGSDQLFARGHGDRYMTVTAISLEEGWQACAAIAQAELDKRDAEIAALKSAIKIAVKALDVSLGIAQDYAEETRQKYKAYKPQRIEAADADVKLIETALNSCSALAVIPAPEVKL